MPTIIQEPTSIRDLRVKGRMLIGVENISKCCSKIGHCQVFHTRKPESPSSISVATKFIMIFHPLFFQNPVNFQCKVDLDIQKKG